MKPELFGKTRQSFGKHPSPSSIMYTSDSLSQRQHLPGEDGSNEETGTKMHALWGYVHKQMETRWCLHQHNTRAVCNLYTRHKFLQAPVQFNAA
jgi:hypothetical protein